MFSKAIVRTPDPSMVTGLTSANLGPPDYDKALLQHQQYISALRSCGVEVTVLPKDGNFPDSTFVEDAALLTPHCAIITNPGAQSRRGEIVSIREAVALFYDTIEAIASPGTLDAGDIMMVGSHYYIGLSERTNGEGARQMVAILEKHGMTGSMVEMNQMLHLKTGLSYLEGNKLLISGEFLQEPQFKGYIQLEIAPEEGYAANSLWVNGKVLVPADYPKTKATVEQAGYETIILDVSEYRKIDGGLSCLSLRF